MDVTRKNLVASGYKLHEPSVIDRCNQLFQRKVYDASGVLYFMSFREWIHPDKIEYDSQLCCKTDTDGYLWATFREASIEAAEERAAKLWKASGSVRYDY